MAYQPLPFLPLSPDLYEKIPLPAQKVMEQGGTELPGTGEYEHFSREGTYFCNRCHSPLYRSSDKFDSGCGWPSFDAEIPHAVERIPDRDGQRIEIRCATCGGHLGHVFSGEGFTSRDVRHCVNSLSLHFAASPPLGRAFFAGGCFWGVEDLFSRLEGVTDVTSGYSGGYVENPSYEDVCRGLTGHLETVRVTYDIDRLSYKDLIHWFFEIHDPTQTDGQGPDIGEQYESAVFYRNRHEYDIALEAIRELEEKGYDIATRLLPAAPFWEAEDYHQDYYERTGSRPYCHAHVKRF
ncbi:bifunctional methionine sulfoxide reductase B/A protein [Parasphaerochaeta coccoides]|uniref:Peptide methionine sulfoxide reductase MsrA n=1 Tax=Parasphaerochaeta coccoides (strain ATCC BAA-1237 / DSM 17374 / SPN1) TaxID=760011 RepID=F4GLN8_PARC1|nr:bifunctional methionine sulfoxide reductase B/A protein [Parasphaerochaeta coccoides]AEC02432.1 Peptide methionine sulfoxide reductase msrA [Parasphaerochaeta coccoides DSM 17374]